MTGTSTHLPDTAHKPMIYPLLRPFLFRLNPEQAHRFTLELLRFTGTFAPARIAVRKLLEAPARPVSAFGLTFRNPVGLAAGYDKDALAWRGLAALGFGHIEVGTVTLRPQHGNPKPRVFRLVEDEGLINRLGFPGQGADFVVERLQGRRPEGLVLGVNIGKNKNTPNEEAAEDYIRLLGRFAPLADYLAVNVSSPNTVGLRRLQAREALEDLLGRLQAARPAHRRVPVLVKLAPDLTDQELEDSVGAILASGMDGIIATNTTVRREGLQSHLREETGGLSGAPLTRQSTEMVRKIVRLVNGSVPVVAVGGIMSAEDAQDKLDAGAVLVQVYTGLIYAGPGLVKQIVRGIK